MDVTGTRISGKRASTSALMSALLVLFLLTGGLPCGSLIGCCCPCTAQNLANTRVEAPGSCCGGSADATLTPSLPAKPQQALAAPASLPAASPDPAPPLLILEMLQLSGAEARSWDPPPLFFLLCTLLI